MEDKSRMAAKIAALLAQAEGEAKAGNEEAVQVFLDKAQALQLKFAIDDAMFKVGDKSREEIKWEEFCTEQNTPLIKAKRELICRLAGLYRGQSVLMGRYRVNDDGTLVQKLHRGKWGPIYDKRAAIRVYAHESDLRFIGQMYVSLILQMQTMMAEDEQKPMAAKTNAWRVSYAYAWVGRVIERLWEAKARQERQANDSQPGTELVLVDRKALVTKHVNENLRTTKGSKVRKDDNGTGTVAGWQAGGRADLGDKKVGSESTKRISSQ